MIQAHLIHDLKSKRKPIDQLFNQCDYIRLWPSIRHENKITAVSKAHKQIVQYAKYQGLEEILICEDDVLFTQSNALKRFLDHKPKEYDIYLAGVSWFKYSFDSFSIERFTGLHCYLIHNRYYDTFLSSDESKHIDQTLRGKFYIHDPMLAIQTGEHLTKYWNRVKKQLNFLNKKKSFIFG